MVSPSQTVCLENNKIHLYLSKKMLKYSEFVTLQQFPLGCVGTTHPVNQWALDHQGMSCWSPWPRMTRTTTQGSGLRSHKSDVAVQVRPASSVSDEWSSLESHCCSQYMSECFYSHHVWRQAVRWLREVHFTQFSKLLSSSNYLSLVNRGNITCKTKICMTDIWMNWLNTVLFYLSWSVSSLRSLLEK